MKNSKIEWTDHTFNPWWGCAKVPGHPGCAHCYAEAFSKRIGRVKWGKGEKRVLMSPEYMKQAIAWNERPWICDGCGRGFKGHTVAAARAGAVGHFAQEPTRKNPTPKVCSGGSFHRARVFCASMADVFDPEVATAWRAILIDLIRLTPNLDWLLLTKRPDAIPKLMAAVFSEHKEDALGDFVWKWHALREPPQNVRLGVSVSDQPTADRYIPTLLKIPAASYFISYEPALGPVNFHLNGEASIECICCKWKGHEEDTEFRFEGEDQIYICPECKEDCAHTPIDEQRDGDNIHWIIVGGESGPKARPFDIAWAQSTIEQCKTAGVACFVKQLGSVPMMRETEWRLLSDQRTTPLLSARNHKKVPADYVGLALNDAKGGNMEEWTSIATCDLRVREFPQVGSVAPRGPSEPITNFQSPIINHQS
jgi:protein gp37